MIPAFTETEITAIRELLNAHGQSDVEVQLADRELAPGPTIAKPTVCPAVHWYHNGANFVVTKVGTSNFRTRFFYTPHEQYDTGQKEYDDLRCCVNAVLREHSDHHRDNDAPGN